MSNYIVSARKYRPATFDSVVGQHALTTTLKNAISQGKLAHAYLFCGPRGVGKTTCARIFAKPSTVSRPLPTAKLATNAKVAKPSTSNVHTTYTSLMPHLTMVSTTFAD